jgi:hypothetical protein
MRVRAAPADLVVLDTLGKLYAHGHGLIGYCRTHQLTYASMLDVDSSERGRLG